MELMSALQCLKLNEIPEDWVDAVWDSDFTERKPLDDTIEEELVVSGDKAFRKLCQCLLLTVSVCYVALQSIWAILGENGVSVKSLVAVLSLFVLAGKAKTATVQQRVNSLHAASVYLLLLGIPGSIANRVFHEVLFDTCSDLASHCWPWDSGKKRKKHSLKSSLAEGKRSKPQRKEMLEMEVDDEEEEEEEELHFSVQDLMKIKDAVVLLIQSLLRLLQTFPLKDRRQNISSCIQVTADSTITPISEKLMSIVFFLNRDTNKLRSVPEMAFYGLELLCSPKHGDQKESLGMVFRQLLYVILMMNKGSRGKPSLLMLSQPILTTRDQAIQFVCHLMDELKEHALPFLKILVQHICIQMVEKSEFRIHGAQAVGMLTSQMTTTDYACFIKWLFNFSRHSKVRYANVARAGRPEECQDPELACFLPHKFLIQSLLFARQMDESPTVKGHALACLAQCLELPLVNVTQAVHSLFSGNDNTHTYIGSLSSQQTQKTYRTLTFRSVELSSTNGSSCESETNLKCCRDPAVSVRKKALQCVGELLFVITICVLITCPNQSFTHFAINCLTLYSFSSDHQAKPECNVVQKTWLQGVVPAVVDSESTVQDKALEALGQVLLNQVKPYSATFHIDASQRLAWDLLGMLCHDRYFSRAFTIWSNQKNFTQTFITNLISHTETDHAAGAWLLLSRAVTSSPKLPLSKILDAWDTMVNSKDISVTTCCHILCVMGDIATHLNKDTKDRIVDDLISRLKTFTLSLEVISAAVDTLYQLGHSEDIKQTQVGDMVFTNFAGLIWVYSKCHITVCQNQASKYTLFQIKHLHTLGVVSLHCPTKVGKRTVLLVESVLTTHSNKLEELPASIPLSQFRPNSLPSRVRAHGVITLGKLCLQHDKLVQKYLPVFARELEVSTEVAVRSSVVVVMCDLCVRYTNIVDHYIPNISACLQDSEAVIREQTLIMLTNLIQEEFVKWKGSLFFRFVVSLVDPDPAIASLCEYCLLHLLLKKNTEIFSQHFIECIFHFNSYSKHKTYNKFPQSEREKVRFSLKGSQHCEKRFRIYRFMLEYLTDAQRFVLTHKINQNVLACFADEELLLDADGAELLSETFSILSLKEMKLQAVCAPSGGTAGEEPEEENMATMAKAVLQAAQKKVVSEVQKKAFIENTVPLIISLKSLLERNRSPVLGDLMAYLQVTMQDYRNEVKEFFSGDAQLAAEVEFALKTAEKDGEMREQMDNHSLTGDAKTTTAQVRIDIVTACFVSLSPEMPKGAVNDRAISTPKGISCSNLYNTSHITHLIFSAGCFQVTHTMIQPHLYSW
uniref:Condensin complex subunit 1 C-terminal domain-containing protein n=1 Tax=Monopterus albus TaxID=43700 RepID=A0A3Q3JDK2_MONAL